MVVTELKGIGNVRGVVTDKTHTQVCPCLFLHGEACCTAPDLSQVLRRKPFKGGLVFFSWETLCLPYVWVSIENRIPSKILSVSI